MNTTRSISLIFALLFASLAAGCISDESVGQSESTISGRPYFELFEGSDSRYYFHLTASNHEIILQSQPYSSRTSALGGVLSVIDNSGTPARFDLLEAKNGQFYFNLKARNGRIIGTSELYSSKQAAQSGIASVESNVGDYLDHLATRTGARFEVSESDNGNFYFNLRAANGQIVLQSEAYSSEAAALNGTFSVADHGVDSKNYDIRESSHGGYYFNLEARNGQVIGTSEVYSSKSNATRARNSIIELLPKVELL